VVLWIVLATVLVGLIILVAVTVPLLGRLGALSRAVRRLQRRRQDALQLQAGAAELEQSALGLQRRAEIAQERVALIKAGHGEPTGRHAR
jgi:HAMP domain-containing protein